MSINTISTEGAEFEKQAETAVAALRSYLDDLELKYEFLPDINGFLVPVNIDGNGLNCFVSCAPGSPIEFAMEYPVSVPKERWDAVLICINALNCQARLGHFVLDTADGRVGFRMGAMIQTEEAIEETIRSHFRLCLRSVVNAEPHFLALFFGSADPLEAAALIMASDGADEPANPSPPEDIEMN